ncbi:MAG: ferrochelatase, partial [Polyangiaceae bacterium]
LISHGTVEDLDDLGAFVTNVRRGRPPPPELVSELRRRYESIWGSPLNSINADIARKLEDRLESGARVVLANRLWRPSVRSVLESLAKDGVKRAAVIALAQHSAHVYAEDARGAAVGTGVEVFCGASWGLRADLCAAFASRIAALLEASADPSRTTLLMTAHSLPRSVVDGGDPYERDIRAAVAAITGDLRVRGAGRGAHVDVAFQSQGLAGPGAGAWLEPGVRAALESARGRGDLHVIAAPIGFLADHVEVLYDLDVEGRYAAGELGLSYARTPSLNASDDFIEILARIAVPLLEEMRR